MGKKLRIFNVHQCMATFHDGRKHAVSYKAPVFFYHFLITKLANHVLILTHQPHVFIQLINAEGLNCK